MSNPIRFNSVAPCFFVRDMVRALAFYKEKLAFTAGHLEGKVPVYVTLHRDGMSLHLMSERPSRPPGTCVCCIFVTNVNALYDQCVAQGIKISRKIEDSPYGLRDFCLRDPDDNEILIGEPIEQVRAG